LFSSETASETPAATSTAVHGTANAPTASFWDKFNLFKSKNPEHEVVSTAAETTGSPPKLPAQIPAAANDPSSHQGGGRKKSRKTRHRRRRSPRHHRK
jgi:hypothetical protein